MRPRFPKSVVGSQAVPTWILQQVGRLARLPLRLPIHEVTEIAQPIWRLPRGIQAAAVLLSLIALIGGVRALDAGIASFEPLEDDDPPPPGSESVLFGRLYAPALPDGFLDSGIAAPAAPPPVIETQPSGILVEQLPPGTTHQFLHVTVTAYCSRPDQTDSTPTLTATSKPTRPGTVALSRDLLRTFTANAPFDFGDRVLIPGMGIYRVEDTMHPRWRMKADLWFSDPQKAKRWGKREVYLARVEGLDARFVSEAWRP